MPDDDLPDDVKALVRMLARYLRDFPLASDTPDGIALWWLRLDWVVHEHAIQAALAKLVKADVVEGVKGPDGRVRYRRIQSTQADAALTELASRNAGTH